MDRGFVTYNIADCENRITVTSRSCSRNHNNVTQIPLLEQKLCLTCKHLVEFRIADARRRV